MGKRRNIPVKYDRELWANTVTAMQRIEEIKNKRQAHHIFQRMKLAKKIQKAKDIKEVERDLALIKSPAAGLKKANDEAMEGEMEDDTEIDTSIRLKSKSKVKSEKKLKLRKYMSLTRKWKRTNFIHMHLLLLFRIIKIILDPFFSE